MAPPFRSLLGLGDMEYFLEESLFGDSDLDLDLVRLLRTFFSVSSILLPDLTVPLSGELEYTLWFLDPLCLSYL